MGTAQRDVGSRGPVLKAEAPLESLTPTNIIPCRQNHCAFERAFSMGGGGGGAVRLLSEDAIRFPWGPFTQI